MAQQEEDGLKPLFGTRRRFLQTLGAGMFSAGINAAFPLASWALSSPKYLHNGIGDYHPETYFDLAFRYTPLEIDGRTGTSTAINGTVPGPLIRWREGDTVTMDVTNHMHDTRHTSIHWHGILVPFRMDGVPGVNFSGIQPGETYRYQFRVKQAGTYWYHSHSFLQEQSGSYGPLVIDPKGGEPFHYDRDHVVVLSDWAFTDPETLFRNINLSPEYYIYYKRTVFDYLRDVRKMGFAEANAELLPFRRMNMSPRDLSNVTGYIYTYLMNGHSPDMNWSGKFLPGETVRLRIINSSSMSNFDVRIPGLDMDVVMVDGKAVKPVRCHEFRIGVAETYDVLIRPREANAYTLYAESLDRSGYARGTLAPEPGMQAPVPALRPVPDRKLEDIGMGMMKGKYFGGMSDAMKEKLHHKRMQMQDDAIPGPNGPMPFLPEKDNPNVAMVVMNPQNRLAEPGVGLGNDGWKVLTYKDLVSAEPQPYKATVDREMCINITANMERFIFSLDGKKFTEQPGPYLFKYHERLRLFLVNHTMMEHPMHLHGMWMQLENGADHEEIPYKHTILIKPGEALSVLITPIEKGDWAFHCHLLYHMEAGMFQVVRVA
ncbi:copper resistance system multicopper oxidase [Microbulbifer bruguierae]|uniref:Copper resistance system multicopper oxidase n=1 Tax=Microbulbifer bruguierae TaxID=3029061 RepID=A0ABY8NDJ3_9GAMM|nr:copper resistance system multicopper oxidase [Microbulbifer bruguierae]WGL16988.1 copper resistance system multicopper oxidase [Microbulbifer bruguierae]